MTTYSQAVDTLIEESRRPDMASMICTYLNATIRDVHFNKANNSLVKFTSNLYEAELIATSDTGFKYEIPAAHRFAKMEAVRYDTLGVDARERTPSTMNAFIGEVGTQYRWYRSGDSIAFTEYGGTDAVILLAWFEYPRRLTYYEAGARPAEWNDETESFTYLPAYDVSDSQKELARDLSTNWLLQRWPDLILEGGRAKLYKRLQDEGRMRAAYSAFESARGAMVAAETYDTVTTYME